MPARLLALVHGQLAVLAVAALLHPALLLRRGRPLSARARWACGAAMALMLAAFATGLWLYEPYRALVRRPLFALSPAAGFAFETKEHLAVVATALALGAVGAALLAPREATALRRVAALACGVTVALALIVTVLGTSLAAFRGMP